MQIRNYFMLVLIFVSTATYGADSIQMFAAKPECLQHFALSGGSSDVAAGENFCKNRIVKSAIDLCADKKLLEFKMKNSISSVDEPKYALKFKTECSQTAPAATVAARSGQQTQQSAQEAERSAQIVQQQAALAEQQKQAAAAAAAKQNQAAAAKQQQANVSNQAQALKELAPVLESAAKEYDKAVAKNSSSGTTSTGSSGISAIDSNKGETIYIDKDGNTYNKVTSETNPDEQYIERTDYNTGAQTKVDDFPKDEVPGKLEGSAVTKDVPALGKEVAGAEKAAEIKPNADGGESPEITGAAKAKTAEVKSEVTTTVEQIKPNLTKHVPASMEPFPATAAALDAFKEKYETFASTTKPTCVKLAETSSFLCVEAPGAKGVKTLMDAAGPILAVVTSIQKACSNTAKITGFAATAMTIAKGTCVAAKLACDGGCALADTSVKALLAQLKSMEATITNDLFDAKGECATECNSKCTDQICYGACTGSCQGYADQLATQARAAVKKITASINKESVPTPAGSVAATQVKCKMNGKDILGLGLNALSLMNAQKGAKECDKKLAASGAAGGAVTPTQYCETPANTGTQFCKCKSNSQQEGCPGFAGKGSVVDKDGKPSDIAGTNSKTVGGGLSSFAGGTKGSVSPASGLNDKINSNASKSDDASKLSLSDAVGSSGAGAGGSVSGNGNGGRSSGATGGVDGKDNNVAEKKWSFGSFANALGGMFGGGGSSGKGSKNSVNGNLNSKQQEAIKRKLASDKLAGEVTSASGKSNWEKVHQVYLIKDNTLLSGQ